MITVFSAAFNFKFIISVYSNIFFPPLFYWSYYYMFSEERIQNYMCEKNGQPHGTFLVPPQVEEHDRKEHQSFYVFQNQAIRVKYYLLYL